jgi:osmotically-inducible protein OsmY
MNKQHHVSGRTLCRNVVLAGSLVVSLQGCIPVILGGAVAGGVAATDRRTLGTQTDDKTIVVRGETQLPKVAGEGAHLNVSAYNGLVLLTGEVASESYRSATGAAMQQIEGVVSVQNELGIGPASSLSSRSNDTFITSKVQASLIDAKDVQFRSLKVVTERGNVYLMGRVTQREGDRAAAIAAGVSGVQKVIKVFGYMSEEELQRLSGTK